MKDQLPIRAFQVLSGILIGLAVVIWVTLSASGGNSKASGAYFLPEPLHAPTFSLPSHLGAEVRSDQFEGKVLAIFFGYTSCPDVCPLTLSHLGRAITALEEEGDRIQVLFISVDPARDTPQRLGDYLGAFHPSFLGLTGPEERIREVADAFGAFFARTGEGDDYTVDHTARTFIVDGSGRIPLTFPVDATPLEMARDLSLVLEMAR